MRLSVYLSVALTVAMIIYVYFDMALLSRNEGLPQLVSRSLIGFHFIDLLSNLPVIVALALSISQFLPELTNKRLKLTLHLPADEIEIISSMLIFGVSIYLIIILLAIGLLYMTLTTFLPFECALAELNGFFVWAFAGLATYGFVTAVCIEPTLHHRIGFAIIGITAVSISYWSNFAEAAYLLKTSVALAIFSLVMAIYSTMRFKRGVM